jgi:hypothetical protein
MCNLILPCGRISQTGPVLCILELSDLDSQTLIYSKGECEMAMLAQWATVLFFLLYGLAAFVPAMSGDTFRKVTAVLALVAGIVGLLVLLGMG